MIKFLATSIFTLTFLFCFSQEVDFQVRCQSNEGDGSVTLESFGKGRNYQDASEQAKKNAVKAVIFKGIRNGSDVCGFDPLLYNSNAERIHEVYFANFFKDGGEYLKYVSTKDEQIKNKVKRNKIKNSEDQQRLVIVRVEKLKLKAMLKQDNIQ
jgi:hypothetical protein